MFGLGFSELLLIMVVVLIVFGPEKLPEIARNLGRASGQFRRAMDEFKFEINSANFDRDLNSNQNLTSPTASAQLPGTPSAQANPTQGGNLEMAGSATALGAVHQNDAQRFGCEADRAKHSAAANPAGPLPSAMPETPFRSPTAHGTSAHQQVSQGQGAPGDGSSVDSSCDQLGSSPASNDTANECTGGNNSPTSDNS